MNEEITVRMREDASFLDAQRIVGDMMDFNTYCDMDLYTDLYGTISVDATWDAPVERIVQFIHARSSPVIVSICSGGRQLA